jgi:hypothetical protein
MIGGLRVARRHDAAVSSDSPQPQLINFNFENRSHIKKHRDKG